MAEMAELKRRPHDSGEDALLVPTGAPLYESLSARLIAYDRLVSTLGRGGYSGYVRILGPGVNGILLFRTGKMIDCLWRGPDQLRKNEEAETAARNLLDSGEAVVDVVDLQAELVDSLHHLASGASTYPEMFASWVNLEGLVAFLKERAFSGTISVKAKDGGGVLMLRQGELDGAFTTESRELSTEETEVLALASDPLARIEVRSATDPAPAHHPHPAEARQEQPAVS
ncbi:MAG TPA: hypothetical protein VNG93_09530 [Candidatus Dormibacteraeota bacterium]|nr:hypothetical protein [Candidatus Dormibacteraeota bacterium]